MYELIFEEWLRLSVTIMGIMALIVGPIEFWRKIRKKRYRWVWLLVGAWLVWLPLGLWFVEMMKRWE